MRPAGEESGNVQSPELKAIPLVNEGCRVYRCLLGFEKIGCRPSLFARPLVSNKDTGEVATIAKTLRSSRGK